jgi:hypothetical protein
MKRFFAGLVFGLLSFALLAQKQSAVVEPQTVVDDQKVRVLAHHLKCSAAGHSNRFSCADISQS